MSTFSIELNAGILERMDIYAIRKQQLISLIGNQKKGVCAERWGMAPAHLSQILSDKTVKNLGDDVARRIEAVEGLPRGWFDSLQPADEREHAASPESESNASVKETSSQWSAADQVKQMLAKVKGLSGEIREKIVMPLITIQQYALIKIKALRESPTPDEKLIAIYEKIVTRSLFGNINASRNSA